MKMDTKIKEELENDFEETTSMYDLKHKNKSGDETQNSVFIDVSEISKSETEFINVEVFPDLASKVKVEPGTSESEDLFKLKIKPETVVSDEPRTNLASGNYTSNNRESNKVCVKGIDGGIGNHVQGNPSKNHESFVCEVCGESFGLMNNYNSHLETHSRSLTTKTLEICKAALHEEEVPTDPLIVYSAKEKFICKQCNMSFLQENDFISHMRIHAGQKPYFCRECGKTFLKQGYLLMHMRIHTGEKPFCCNECGRSFPHKSDLTKHIRMHLGEKQFECSECQKLFNAKSSLNRHMKIHLSEKPLVCKEGLQHNQLENFIAENEHADKDPLKEVDARCDSLQVEENVSKAFTCTICSSIFTSKNDLDIHSVKHLEVNVSKKIEKVSFSMEENLTNPLVVHCGKKMFTCKQCGKSFLHESSFIRHMRVHTGEKPFVCSECGKSFPHQGSLHSHKRLHLGDRPFCCEECGKSFPHKSDLTKHTRTHTGEKPYSCRKCLKVFAVKSSLNRHLRLHTADRSILDRYGVSLEGSHLFVHENSLG